MYSYSIEAKQQPRGRKPAAQEDLDAAVVGLLAKITEGQVARFADQTRPPRVVVEQMARADHREARALVCLALRRWCELGA